MQIRRAQLIKLAEAAKLLLLEKNRGRCKSEEITKKAFAETTPFWRVLVPEVQKRLKAIKELIEREDGSAMHILMPSESWWLAGCPTPQTLEEAITYLAGGYGKPGFGFYLVTSKNDLLYLATHKKGTMSPVGRLKNINNETVRAARDGIISKEQGNRFISDLKASAFPPAQLKP